MPCLSHLLHSTSQNLQSHVSHQVFNSHCTLGYNSLERLKQNLHCYVILFQTEIGLFVLQKPPVLISLISLLQRSTECPRKTPILPLQKYSKSLCLLFLTKTVLDYFVWLHWIAKRFWILFFFLKKNKTVIRIYVWHCTETIHILYSIYQTT